MLDQLPMPVTAPLSASQKTTIRNLVRRAVRAEITPRFRKLDSGQISTKSGPEDLVTEADIGAEAIITRGLQMAFPSTLIIGEEAASKDDKILEKLGEAELSFLIDPVDGTWNFAQGLPMFGTIVAACRFGRPVYGLIHDPIGDDAMEADLQGRALHRLPNTAPRLLVTSPDKELSEMTGYTHMSIMPLADKALVSDCIPKLNLLSTLRCSAHEYRMLAQGSIDFVLSVRMTPWDHAAGVVLCQQAGGFAAMLDGRDYTATEQGYLLCASSKATWDKVASLFADLLSED
ncbi:MAG: inositol monophosphatase [Paracoccaceae bacterium]